MPKLSIYKVAIKPGEELQMATVMKYGQEFQLLSTYRLHFGLPGGEWQGKPTWCTCVARVFPCRHQKIYQLFKDRGAINTTRFLMYDHLKGNHKWMPPFPDEISNG